MAANVESLSDDVPRSRFSPVSLIRAGLARWLNCDRTRPASVELFVGETTLESQLQSREAELIVTAFRTLVLLLALCAPRILGLSGQYEMEEVWLAGVAGIYNIITGLSCLRPGRYGLRRSVMVVMDMLLITLWIRLSGQWELFPFYFLVVAVAAMWFKVSGGALAAAFCNFFFLLLWSRAAGNPEIARIPIFTTSMALGTLLLFLVGCLVGYIAEIQERERERYLESQLLVANYQREIDLSSHLQPLLSGDQNQQFPSLAIGLAGQSARELGGGDYVDAISLGPTQTLICIADVSGKSVRAQARLPLLKYSLRALAPLHTNPAELVMRLNETLAPDLQPELYIAFCCVVLDTKAGVLSWCNAGHIAPLLVSDKNGAISEQPNIQPNVQPLETSGPPLGLFPGLEYSGGETKWRQSDQILFYTDGLSDAFSYNNTEDGEAQVRRLASRLALTREKPADEVAQEFVALAVAALEAANELPERLRARLNTSLSTLRPRTVVESGAIADVPAPRQEQSHAQSTPGHRDDITVVVVRGK